MEERPVRPDGGDDHRRLRRRAPSGATSTSAGNTRWRRPASAHAIRHARAARTARARRSWAPRSPSTSKSAVAPAPTSAARRQPSSSRSRAFAANHATSRRSRCSRARSASRPPSTTSRPWSTCCRSADGAAHLRGDRHRRLTGTKLFSLSGHVARPGVYEVPFGTTLRALIELAGGVPRTGRTRPSGRSCSGGAAGVFVAPEELDIPLTFEGTRARGATLGWRGDGLRPRRTWRGDPCGASPRSSATSRAGSACPVASAPCARRSCSPASPRDRPRSRSGDELGLLRRARPGDARRVDLRPWPDGVVGHRVGPPPPELLAS